jgi:hypothetical protein
MSFDVEKAASHAVTDAAPGSTGKCARYARLALEAGGARYVGCASIRKGLWCLA